MKLFIVSVFSLALTACASHTETQSVVVPTQTDAMTVVCGPLPDNCYQMADAICAPDEGSMFSQSHKSGRWHQVPDAGMSFPAIIQDGHNSWRMTIVCE